MDAKIYSVLNLKMDNKMKKIHVLKTVVATRSEDGTWNEQKYESFHTNLNVLKSMLKDKFPNIVFVENEYITFLVTDNRKIYDGIHVHYGEIYHERLNIKL